MLKDEYSLEVLQNEFAALAHPASLWSTAVAWSESPAVRLLFFGETTRSSSNTDRSVWDKAMKILMNKVGSHETTLCSWEEAEQYLFEVVSPPPPTVDASSTTSQGSHISKSMIKQTPFKRVHNPSFGKGLKTRGRDMVDFVKEKTKSRLQRLAQKTPRSGDSSVEKYLKRIQRAMAEKSIHWTFSAPSSSSTSSSTAATTTTGIASQTIQAMKIPTPLTSTSLFNDSHSLSASVEVQPEPSQETKIQESAFPPPSNSLPSTSSSSDPNALLDEMIDSLLVDQLLQQRISDTERHRQYEQRQRDIRIERDMAAKERELEGAQRAKSLLRPLTPTESELVRNALYGEGNPQQVVARYESKETGFIDSMQRESMRRLKPGKWLNDEVIHYFYTMLANRDAEMSQESPSRKRCHFFKSFFITKLLDEGYTNRYTYSNVKRWSKNVPGKDIFGLDKVFIPVNIGNAHWACLVIFIQERRIQFFDSLGGDGMYYMDAAMQYLKDEWKSKNPGQELPHLSEWKKVKTTIETPKQQNGFDCGVFTCMFADFLSMKYPLSFTQEHITQCRERIALSILQGCAIR